MKKSIALLIVCFFAFSSIISLASTNPQLNKLIVHSPPSDKDKETKSSHFSEIPSMVGCIVLEKTSHVKITFSAEASCSAGKRMFVRALIDGKSAQPSDVVFASGDYVGTRSFTFTKSNVSAGSHTIQIQWMVDAGGYGYIGDRTLSVFSSPELTKHGGILAKAATSGANEVTYSTTFQDIPDMNQAILTAGNSDLEINFNAEITADQSGQKLFVRALVDGLPAKPSDILVSVGRTDEVHSFSFVKEDLSPGAHTIQMQWKVDSTGQKGIIGDRMISCN